MFNDTTPNTTLNTTLKLTILQQNILKYLKVHPNAPRPELVNNIGGATTNGIKYNMIRLQKLGLLKRVGNKRSGHWIVTDDQ